MAEAFQISCVERSMTNWGHRHITGLGTAAKPGSPERWAIATVLGRVAEGDLFYAVNALGEPVFVHPYRCWCGTRTVRTTSDDDTSDLLDTVVSCDWEPQDAESQTLPPFRMMAQT
jgi:hypothetical protein